MSIKFLVLGKGVFWVWGGGGSADFIFIGAGIFYDLWEFPNLVVSNLVVCNFLRSFALFCALFVPFCAPLRTCVCALLRAFALFCAHFCVFLRPTAFRTTAFGNFFRGSRTSASWRLLQRDPSAKEISRISTSSRLSLSLSAVHKRGQEKKGPPDIAPKSFSQKEPKWCSVLSIGVCKGNLHFEIGHFLRRNSWMISGVPFLSRPLCFTADSPFMDNALKPHLLWGKGGFGGCSPGTKTGTRVHSDVLLERKPERGYVRMNENRNENRNEGTFAKTTLLQNRPLSTLDNLAHWRVSSETVYIFRGQK